MNLDEESKLKKITLNLCVLIPNRIIWDSKVKEIILPTQIKRT